jgi:hypothetical protein
VVVIAATRARWVTPALALVAACGGGPAPPDRVASPPPPPPAVATPAEAPAPASIDAPAASASGSASDEAELPRARDPRGVSKRADGACFEFKATPCPPDRSCKPPQPRRVRCPD